MYKKNQLRLIKLGEQYINPNHIVRVYEWQGTVVVSLTNDKKLTFSRTSLKDVLKAVNAQVTDITGEKNAKK